MMTTLPRAPTSWAASLGMTSALTAAPGTGPPILPPPALSCVLRAVGNLIYLDCLG